MSSNDFRHHSFISSSPWRHVQYTVKIHQFTIQWFSIDLCVCVCWEGECFCDLQCLNKIFCFTSLQKISRNPISIETTSKFCMFLVSLFCLLVSECMFACQAYFNSSTSSRSLANLYLICSTENCFICCVVLILFLDFMSGSLQVQY